MANEPPNRILNDEVKQNVIRQGGRYSIAHEKGESFLDWLSFITNPLNLQPGLPELTITTDYHVFENSTIVVSFDKLKASLRSFKLALNDYQESSEVYLDTDPSETKSLVDGKPLKPKHLRKWVFNLFLHTELQELQLPFSASELPDLFAMVENGKRPDL